MVLLFLVIDHLSLLFTFPNQDYQIAAWVINRLELMKLSYLFKLLITILNCKLEQGRVRLATKRKSVLSMGHTFINVPLQICQSCTWKEFYFKEKMFTNFK